MRDNPRHWILLDCMKPCSVHLGWYIQKMLQLCYQWKNLFYLHLCVGLCFHHFHLWNDESSEWQLYLISQSDNGTSAFLDQEKFTADELQVSYSIYHYISALRRHLYHYIYLRHPIQPSTIIFIPWPTYPYPTHGIWSFHTPTT